MSEFLQLISTLPVVVFTALMGLALCYWLLVILGAVDIDVLDIEGLAEAMDSGLDGAFDAAVEGGIEAAEGALDAGAEGAADVDATPGGLAGVVHALGLQGVPLTISMSLLVFVGWVVSMALVAGIDRWLGSFAGTVPAILLVLVASFVLGVVSAAQAIRPIRPAFETVHAPLRSSFTGRVCTIVSTRVDAGFGRAEIEDGGAGLLVDVRCPEPNSLTRGDFALVFDYDREEDVYLVSPAESGLTA